MSDFFDKIATQETLELKTAEVVVNDIKFTVHELTPIEMARCVDEFGDVDFLAIIYRSVKDPDGRRMSKEQAKRLPPEIISKFIEAYNEFIDTKKKSKT